MENRPHRCLAFEALAGAIFFSAGQLHLVRPSRDVTTAAGPTQPERRKVTYASGTGPKHWI